jgi:hypothetical protein
MKKEKKKKGNKRESLITRENKRSRNFVPFKEEKAKMFEKCSVARKRGFFRIIG